MKPLRTVPASGTAFVLAALLPLSAAGGAALQFDGVNDAVSVPDSATLRITGPITIEAWIKRAARGVQHSVVEKYGCSGAGGYALRVTASDKLLFGTRDDCNNGSSVLGATTIPANVWTHLAGSWDGATLRVFVNGLLDGSLATTRNPKAGNSPLKIGERGNGGTLFFGAMDDVRVWRTARSPAQIQSARNLCLVGNESELAGYWRLDEAGGLIAFDATANANNGTLINRPLWLTLGAPITCGAALPPTPPPTPGPLPTVGIAATEPETMEFFPDGIHALIPGAFTAWRTGGTASNLVVNFAVSGTSSNGVDYADMGGTITIPAGAASAVIPILPIDDFEIEGPETVVVTLVTNAAYFVGVPAFDTVTLLDNDPTVSIEVIDPVASEDGHPATFKISRTGPTSAPLAVLFRVQGTALPGLDYLSIGSGALIPAGEAFTTLSLTPLDDLLVEGPETVLVRLEPDPTYTIGLGQAEATILDNDSPDAPSASPLVSVAATQAAIEFFPDGIHTNIPGMFTLFRTGSTAGPLAVSYNLSGTAINGVDYQVLPGVVTFPAGASTVPILLNAIDDGVVEAAETVTLTLNAGAGYAPGNSPAATLTITDNDPTVSIWALDGLATETGETGTFRFIRTGPTNSPLLVSYRQTGTATPGLDYIDPGNFVAIPAGMSFVDLKIMPMEDALPEGTEQVEFRLAKLSGYSVGNGIASIALADNEIPLPPPVTVGLSTSVATASESGPGPAILTVTRTGSTVLPLTVNYSIGGTAIIGVDYFPPAAPQPGQLVIPAGGSSTPIVILPIDDSVSEGPETIVVTLLPSFDYIIANGASTATVTITDNDAAPPPPALTALQFNGVNQSAQIPASPSVQITGPITVEAWIKRASTGVQHSIVEKYGCNTGQGGYVLRVTAGDKLMFGTRDDCNLGTSVVGATTLAANTWYHVAGTWDGTSLRVYVNGHLDTTALPSTRSPKPGNTPLKIGERGSGGTPFNGWMDEVRLWQVARSAADLLANKNHCVAATTPGLAGYWRLDEGAGAIAGDASPNGNQAALINTPVWGPATTPITCP